MSPDAERLIELAVRPLENNAELKLTGLEELRRRIEENSASPEELKAAADSLEHADRHPKRRYWRAALYVTTLLVSLPVFVHAARQFLVNYGYFASVTSWSAPLVTSREATLVAGITPQQKLLLFGNESASTQAARWKPLWESEPNNPAFFMQYASACFRDNDYKLPPEILAEAARIDPDNAWYPATSAAEMSKEAVEKTKLTTAEQKAGKAYVWIIKDGKLLANSMELLHEAAAKPRFTVYQKALNQQRLPLFHKKEDMAGVLPPMLYMAGQSISVIHFRRLADAISARAQECAANKDVSGFHQIVSDWQWLVKAIANDGNCLIELLIAKVIYTAPLPNLRDAASSLGLEEEARRFSEKYAQVRAEKEARDVCAKGKDAAEELLMQKGSLFAAMDMPMVARQVKTPPFLSAADYLPGRYADHAVFGRAASLAVWILLGLGSAFAALHRYRQSRYVRMLSSRMVDLLGTCDRAWICIGGILLPVLWYLGITRLVPALSAREWRINLSAFIQPGGQFGSMAVLLFVVPLVLAMWRLNRRGRMLGLSSRMWPGWVAIGSAVLALPVFGAIMLHDVDRSILIVSCILLSITLLWLLVGFCRNVLGRHRHSLRRATLARAVLPAWIFGMLVMAASAAFHYAEERYWIQREHLFDVTDTYTRYEGEVTQQLRKELLEMMR